MDMISNREHDMVDLISEKLVKLRNVTYLNISHNNSDISEILATFVSVTDGLLKAVQEHLNSVRFGQ